MKTFLGSDKVPFEWANMEELRAEAKKYDVRIGDGVLIGDDVHIGSDVYIGDDVTIGNGVHIGNGVRIGNDAYIWSGVHIGDGVYILDDVLIGDDVHIGSRVHIGGDVHIGNGVRIRDDVRIWGDVHIGDDVRGAVVNTMHLAGLYEYHIDIIWTEEDVYIRLGCFTRTKTEWEGDLWNNDSEFSQESLERKRRWNALKVCLQIIENEK